MIEQIKKINDIRNCTKEQLLKKISEAKNSSFTIHILRESETIIAQYALLTMSQEEEKEYGSLSRGNLVGIKDKVIKELKEELYKATNGNNIEPPEDKYAADLGKIYYEIKRKYILESYIIHDCQDALFRREYKVDDRRNKRKIFRSQGFYCQSIRKNRRRSRTCI